MTIEPVALAGHREVLVRDDDGRVSRHFVILCFAARWIAGEPKLNEELAEARWLQARRTHGLKTTEGWPRSSPRPSSAWKPQAERRGLRRRQGGAYVTRSDAQTHPDRRRRCTCRGWPDRPARRPHIEGGPAPFDGDLHAARRNPRRAALSARLCGANEGQKWRERDAGPARRRGPERRPAQPPGGELQPRLSQLPADLPHLHAGRRPSRSAAISTKAPRSPARSPRATPTSRRAVSR